MPKKSTKKEVSLDIETIENETIEAETVECTHNNLAVTEGKTVCLNCGIVV